MMREQRGRHFDPVLLDAFMDVLERSGPDAARSCAAIRPSAGRGTLETFGTALERGDAETAEGAIATGDRGRHPGDDAARRGDRAGAGAKPRAARRRRDRRRPRDALAKGITRRVLATLYRYMMGDTEPTRERVLLAGMEGDEHTLGLQMMHDQLAAAGYETVLRHRPVGRRAAVDRRKPIAPTLIVLGATDGEERERSPRPCEQLRAAHPEHADRARRTRPSAARCRASRNGMRVLERIDRRRSKRCDGAAAAASPRKRPASL